MNVAAPALKNYETSRTSRSAQSAIARKMRRLGTWRIAVPAAIVFVPFAIALFATSASFSVPTVESSCGVAPLDVRFYTNGGGVHQFLSDCGDAGREAYRNLQIADLFYPAVSGLFFASTTAIALMRLAPRRPMLVGLAGLAILGTVFDYVENIFAWRAIGAFPGEAGTNALLGLASAAKTTSSWLAGLILMGALAALAARRIRQVVAAARSSSSRALLD